MSMRATYTTDFIYDMSRGYKSRYKKMVDVFETGQGYKHRAVGNCIGQIAGITKGLDLSESETRRYIEEIVFDLAKVTIIPFKIVWLLEGGDIIVKEVKPLLK